MRLRRTPRYRVQLFFRPVGTDDHVSYVEIPCATWAETERVGKSLLRSHGLALGPRWVKAWKVDRRGCQVEAREVFL